MGRLDPGVRGPGADVLRGPQQGLGMHRPHPCEESLSELRLGKGFLEPSCVVESKSVLATISLSLRH